MILGLDIGSMAISAVLLNAEQEISGTYYEAHHGQLNKCLTKIASQLDAKNQAVISLTSSTLINTEEIINQRRLLR